MAKSMTKIRQERTLAETFRFIKQVATEYCETPTSTARSKFIDKYGITESCYYSCLDYAVSYGLISDTLVRKMEEKLKVNQREHGNHGYYTHEKIISLVSQRDAVSAFYKKDIANIATYFADHPEESVEDISKRFSFATTRMFTLVLYKACAELIITDKVYNKLKNRSLSNNPKIESAKKMFEKLDSLRADEKLKRKSKKSSPAF